MALDSQPIDYSKTQRVVLIIDLSPILNHQSPNLYLESMLSSARTLLHFKPLSQSLSSFKLFFSSLSPLISSSTLLSILTNNSHSSSSSSSSSYNPNSLSFDRSHQTLNSLAETLALISDVNQCAGLDCVPKAAFAATSTLQIVHDYAWEVQVSDPQGTSSDDSPDFGHLDFVRSNLVVLFSPLCTSFMGLCDYFGVDYSSRKVDRDIIDTFSDKFLGVFQSVKFAFVARDIHLCWADTTYEGEREFEKKPQSNESERLLKFFRVGLRSLGWGFSSTSSIVLGSALVPFGLIYPSIGTFPAIHNLSTHPRRIVGELYLEISDVNGKPMQSRCCELQLHDLKSLHSHKSIDYPLNLESLNLETEVDCKAKTIWNLLGDSAVKIDVKLIQRGNDIMKMVDCLSDVALVSELSEESKRNKVESSCEFFEDRIVEILSKEVSDHVKKKSVPIWPILLSFLYRRGYWALVSVSDSNGRICTGILKPFTIQSALLSAMKSDDLSPSCRLEHSLGEINMDRDVNKSEMTQGVEIKRKSKKSPRMYDLSWSSFCESVYSLPEMKLEEAYFSRSRGTSKKLKFIKCWTKQVDKSGDSLQHWLAQEVLVSSKVENGEERVNTVHEERVQPVPLPFPPGENCLPEYLQAGQSSDALFSESSETFFCNLCERIEQGLESGVDLEAFAHRLVKSSIYWLCKKLEPCTNLEGQASSEGLNCRSSDCVITQELVKILLKDPKHLLKKHKENETSTPQECDVRARNFLSEHKIREYELQILFRMEILRSGIAAGVQDSTKQRFVKHICAFLEMIQCNMEGGFFGDFNLHDYVGKIIKSRYSVNLGDVILKIYERMDLLLFDNEDEAPNPLLNSEDSNQSWREKTSREPTNDNDRVATLSSDDSVFPWAIQQTDSQRDTNQAGLGHSLRLEEARQKRERARRFSSFTRGVPVLQRVWAPKKPKVSRSKSDSLQKRRFRKEHLQREICDKVCETPMTGKKRFWSQGQEHDPVGVTKKSPPSSVYKALFGDD